MKNSSRGQTSGFTLIELLVVIGIIGLLSSAVLATMSGARAKARDAYRKQELKQIENALELYYAKYGQYPSTGAVSPSTGNYSYSTSGTWLSFLVSEGFFSSAPKDPVNIDTGPWCWNGNSTQNTIFTYGSDGTHYILCAWMENTSDPATLQYRDVPNPWNTSQMLRANHSYSNYNIVITR
jgi:general secretion pathway protein G